MSSKIDNTLFFAHEHALEHEPGPKCGSELTLKHGKHGPFLAVATTQAVITSKPRTTMMDTSSKSLAFLVQIVVTSCITPRALWDVCWLQ